MELFTITLITFEIPFKYYNLQSPLYNQEPYTVHQNRLGKLSYHMAAAHSVHCQTAIKPQAPAKMRHM